MITQIGSTSSGLGFPGGSGGACIETGVTSPPGILVPGGNQVGKSRTEDMVNTAPPGRIVPVGRLRGALVLLGPGGEDSLVGGQLTTRLPCYSIQVSTRAQYNFLMILQT
jgi:hypothetical protein